MDPIACLLCHLHATDSSNSLSSATPADPWILFSCVVCKPFLHEYKVSYAHDAGHIWLLNYADKEKKTESLKAVPPLHGNTFSRSMKIATVDYMHL